MYEDEACTKEIVTIETGEDGISHFDSLEFGSTVYIKETKAPKGYELSDEVVKVDINEAWINGDKETKVIRCADRPEQPQSVNTGDNSNTWILLCMVWMSMTVILLLGKKDQKHCKKKVGN